MCLGGALEFDMVRIKRTISGIAIKKPTLKTKEAHFERNYKTGVWSCRGMSLPGKVVDYESIKL